MWLTIEQWDKLDGLVVKSPFCSPLEDSRSSVFVVAYNDLEFKF